MKQLIEVHKKEWDGYYMEMVQVKRLLVIPNQIYEHFSEVMVNENDF